MAVEEQDAAVAEAAEARAAELRELEEYLSQPDH